MSSLRHVEGKKSGGSEELVWMEGDFLGLLSLHSAPGSRARCPLCSTDTKLPLEPAASQLGILLTWGNVKWTPRS